LFYPEEPLFRQQAPVPVHRRVPPYETPCYAALLCGNFYFDNNGL
jgi:hypothetical protein